MNPDLLKRKHEEYLKLCEQIELDQNQLLETIGSKFKHLDITIVSEESKIVFEETHRFELYFNRAEYTLVFELTDDIYKYHLEDVLSEIGEETDFFITKVADISEIKELDTYQKSKLRLRIKIAYLQIINLIKVKYIKLMQDLTQSNTIYQITFQTDDDALPNQIFFTNNSKSMQRKLKELEELREYSKKYQNYRKSGFLKDISGAIESSIKKKK